MKPTRLDRKTVYSSPWVTLHLDKVAFPAGRVIEQYHMLDYTRQAVAGIVTGPDDTILLVAAYRYTTDSIEWEIPAGGIDEGEDPIKAIRREIQEETGYDSNHHEFLTSFYPMNGNSNMVFNLTRCQAGDQLTTEFDRNEIKEVRWFTITEVQDMIANRIIQDGYTLVGLLWYLSGITSNDSLKK